MRNAAPLLLLLVLCSQVTGEERPSTPSAGEEQLEDLTGVRFAVPYARLARLGLDMESLATEPPDLRVRRVLADEADGAGAGAGAGACDANAPSSDPRLATSDRLVAADGQALSLSPLEDVLAMPVGYSVVLPLFKAATPEHEANILTGFARIEILRPTTVEFETTTAARRRELQAWQAEVARREQAALDRELEERERRAALENDAVEKKAREDRERAERERLEMTPHEKVPQKRHVGVEFRYEVLFTTKGPIGLNWDLHTVDRTIVSHLEPKLPADQTHVIAPRDQLIRINDVDTTAMGPHEVVQAYLESTPPRTMVFLCPRDAKKAAAAAKKAGGLGISGLGAVPINGGEDGRRKGENWTMILEEPSILSDWRLRLHLADWCEPPMALANVTMQLRLATPITGCLPQPPVATAGERPKVMYLTYRGGCSFIDKATTIQETAATALVVVNNVKGPGRFPAKMPHIPDAPAIPVTMMSKVDGELLMSVLETQEVRFRIEEEDPSLLPPEVPVAPRPLTNEELVHRRNPKKAARGMHFWYVSGAPSAATASPSTSSVAAIVPATKRNSEQIFTVLPALFGGNITTMPFRVVMAYPQETACHPQGLGIRATQAVVLVKRGACSFGVKAKSVQDVGGAGMLMINSDDSLIPLMSDPKETTEVTIWAASIGLTNGTFIQDIVERNKNLPSLIKVSTENPLASG